MNASPENLTTPGRVVSLHLHPVTPGDPLISVSDFEAVAARGIVGNGRYFDRLSRKTGKPTQRQVSLMEREQISEHAATLGLEAISPGAVRANIETGEVDLIKLIGRKVAIGDAILFFYEARVPCEKMDAVCTGLRGLMENNRQGVMAEIVQSGRIRVGDGVRLIEEF